MNLIYNGKLLDFYQEKPTLISLVDAQQFQITVHQISSAVYHEPYVLLVNKHGVSLYDEFLSTSYCSINLVGKLFLLNSVPYLFNGKFFQLSYQVSKKSALAAKQIKHICALPPLGQFLSFDQQVLYVSPNHEILVVYNVQSTIVAENLSDSFISPDFLTVLYYYGMLLYILEECVTACFLNDLSLVDLPVQVRNPFLHQHKLCDYENQFAVQDLLLRHVKPITSRAFQLLSYAPKLPQTAYYHSFRQEFALCNIEANNGLQLHPFPYANVALLNRAQVPTKPLPYGVQTTNFFFDPPLTVKVDGLLQFSDFERIFNNISTVPAPRRCFSIVFFSPFDFFLFGGIDQNERPLSDLYCGTVDFAAKTVVYQRVEAENAPKSFGGAMVLSGDQIYYLWGTVNGRRSTSVYQLKRIGEKIRFKQTLYFDQPTPHNGVHTVAIEDSIVVIGPEIALYNTQSGCWSQALQFPEALPYMNYLVAYEDDRLLCYSPEFKFNLSDIYEQLKTTYGEGRIEYAFQYAEDLIANDYMSARDFCAQNRILIYRLLTTKCYVENKEVLEEIIDIAPGKLLIDFVVKCLEKLRIETSDGYGVGAESISIKREVVFSELTLWLCEI